MYKLLTDCYIYNILCYDNIVYIWNIYPTFADSLRYISRSICEGNAMHTLGFLPIDTTTNHPRFCDCSAI